MKILFVTGEFDCECEGTGIVQRTVKAPADYNPDWERMREKGAPMGEQLDEEMTINCLCDCVKAMEATLERFNYDYDSNVTEGQIVPDKE